MNLQEKIREIKDWAKEFQLSDEEANKALRKYRLITFFLDGNFDVLRISVREKTLIEELIKKIGFANSPINTYLRENPFVKKDLKNS
jgi:hypothetical protein